MATRPSGPKPKSRPRGRSSSPPTDPAATASPSSAPSSPDNSNSSSAADLGALDAFCAELPTHEDISIGTWESCHDDLDLRLPLWLSAADAAAGGVREVAFSRTVHSQPGDGEAGDRSAPRREKARCEVLVPAGVRDSDQLVLKGLGDSVPGRVGDLIVTLRIKR